MGRVGREIGAVAPEVRALSAGRIIVENEASEKDFTEGEAEGNILVGGGIGVTVATFPTEQ